MLQIKDPNLSISGSSDHSIVMAMRHELDRKDILRVPSSDSASQLKLFSFTV
jgi:hypothetical protein